MRLRLSVLLLTGLAGSACASAEPVPGETTLDVTPEMLAMFQAVPRVDPETAADCRYANETRLLIANDPFLDIRKSIDGVVAQDSRMQADVWSLVLVREAKRVGIDPASVVGPLQASYANRRKGVGVDDYNAHLSVATLCDATMKGTVDEGKNR